MSQRNEPDTGEYDLEEIRRRVPAARPDGAVPDCRRTAIEYAAGTHPGHLRGNNEDHYLVSRLCRTAETLATNLPDGYVPGRFQQDAYAFAVADGMGGAAAGEVASALALSLGTSLTLDASRWHLQLDEKTAIRLSERVSEFFRIIDNALAQRAREQPELSGMGTTLTVAYAVGFQGLVFHIGDSRAYLWRKGVLQQITRDETIAQQMVDAGQIAAEAVATHPMRHVLTRAMGAGAGGAVVSPLRFEPDDCLLLCTDGLSDMVSDARIAAILADRADLDQASQSLIAEALASGGHDNVTVVLARFRAA